MRSNKVQAIIFDFDGVICESVNVKTEAFKRLFIDYPEHQDQIVNHHLVNGGISRYEKFKVIYQDFLKQELSPEKSNELGEKFSEYVLEGVLNADFVEGAHEFLEKYHKEIMLFIASGTPEEELIHIIQERELNRFFKGVFGSPKEKPEIISEIRRDFGLKKEEMIFVGDAVSDYKGAKESDVRFIGRFDPDNPHLFEDVEVKDKIENLFDLESLLKAENSL